MGLRVGGKYIWCFVILVIFMRGWGEGGGGGGGEGGAVFKGSRGHCIILLS